MMRVERIVSPLPNDRRDVTVKINEFFEQNWLTKDDIAHIDMNVSDGVVAVYIFYEAKD